MRGPVSARPPAARRRAVFIVVGVGLSAATLLLVARHRSDGDRTAVTTSNSGGKRVPLPAGWGTVSPPSPASGGAALSLSECVQGRHCPAGTMCWRTTSGGLGCFASNCAPGSESCGDGMRCTMVSGADKIYRCMPAGTVAAGGACDDRAHAASELNCEGDLVCFHGRCRPSCAQSSDCAGGAHCAAIGGGHRVCLADACDTDSDCPPARPFCADLLDSSPTTCVAVATGSCRPNSCLGGQACDAVVTRGELRGSCRAVCNPAEGGSGCPEGTVCLAPRGLVSELGHQPTALCYRTCNFLAGGPCAQGEVCSAPGGDQTRAACVPRPTGAAPSAITAVAWDDPIARPQ